jgi:hypothetical protein
MNFELIHLYEILTILFALTIFYLVRFQKWNGFYGRPKTRNLRQDLILFSVTIGMIVCWLMSAVEFILKG